ncbi:MAG: ribosome biogenesis GTP-binding protein YihA/YsxC [Clostridia bacterium]|nr:ribosome biogenesis GTP-binding protein YihA/YsxC [Clostridia bacterium]
MTIDQIELACVTVDREGYPKDNLPEIALVGRSNVGKSSFINCIADKKNYARTSSQPGKTRTINFYRCNNRFYIVDLPGYGFAKAPKSIKDKWATMIEEYLNTRKQLIHIIQLLDIRHTPTTEDVMMSEWLEHYNFSKTVVVTKADKISKGRRKGNVDKIKDRLSITNRNLIIFSAKDGTGKNDILKLLNSI